MKCEHCAKRYATWDGLRRHMAEKHGDKSLPAIEPKPAIRISFNSNT